MTTPTLFKEYVWIVSTIRRARRITFPEIQKKWLQTEMSNGTELSRSTFNRHRDAILSIFGIFINCDRRDNYRYFIENEHLLHEDTVQNWMLSTLTVNNIVGESLSIQDRIVLEQIPCDDYLQTVIDAMKKQVRIVIRYRRYGSDTISEVNIEPYCLKLFNQRWYLLAHFPDGAPTRHPGSFVVYAFDRIQEMTLTDTHFEVRSDFDAQGFFSECFGVVAGDGTPAQRIRLRVYGLQRYYLRDLPLHPSQQLVAQGDDWADYTLYLRPTIDFCAHLLSLSSTVQVLEPQSLADRLCTMLTDTLRRYHPEKD